MLQAELQKEKEDAIRDFLDQIEEFKYSAATNEFEQTECVICMEAFKEGKMIKRIPNCRHFFHPDCIMQWFESKSQEDEQRCPQCNVVLKTSEMRAAKARNLVMLRQLPGNLDFYAEGKKDGTINLKGMGGKNQSGRVVQTPMKRSSKLDSTGHNQT